MFSSATLPVASYSQNSDFKNFPKGGPLHAQTSLSMDESTRVGLSFQSVRAQAIRDCPLIIWDEISMSHVRAFTAFDEWLRPWINLFGDKVIVFAGDFRQILPVVPSADPAAIVRLTVKNSILWQRVQHLKLTTSMRVSLEERDFSTFVLGVGDASLPLPAHIPAGSIVVPNEILCSKQDLIRFVMATGAPSGDCPAACCAQLGRWRSEQTSLRQNHGSCFQNLPQQWLQCLCRWRGWRSKHWWGVQTQSAYWIPQQTESTVDAAASSHT